MNFHIAQLIIAPNQHTEDIESITLLFLNKVKARAIFDHPDNLALRESRFTSAEWLTAYKKDLLTAFKMQVSFFKTAYMNRTRLLALEKLKEERKNLLHILTAMEKQFPQNKNIAELRQAWEDQNYDDI